MTFSLLLAVWAAPPPAVAMVVRSEETALLEAAAQLGDALAGRPLTVQSPVAARPSPVQTPLAAAEALFGRAKKAYAELDAPAATSRLAELLTLLRPWQDVDGVPALLARALRLRAQVQFFVGELAAASETVASASFLDPDFTPAAEEWPPETRLAYADTLAALRRAAPAALSIRVEPEVAEVWVDGQLRGVGSLTVSELAPGPHHLAVISAGYERFAAVIAVAGEGRLEQVDVFLQALPAGDQRQHALAGLLERLEQTDEATAVRQAQAVLGVAWLVLIGWDTQSAEQWRPAAWLFDGNGKRRGGLLGLAEIANTAGELERRILGLQLPPPSLAAPWYEHWITWAAGGVALVGGLVALTWWLTADDSERVSFYLGGRR